MGKFARGGPDSQGGEGLESARKPPFTRFWSYARGHRSHILLAASCSILNKFFDLAPPALIGAAVDVVVRKQDSLIAGFGFPGILEQLWILAGLTLLIWGFESLFQYAYAILWRNLAQTLQHEMRIDAYAHVQELGMEFFEDQSTGGLMAILNDDVNQLERFLDGGANDILQVCTTVIVVGSAFFYLAPGVAWMAMLPMPFILWGSFAFQKRLAPRYADVREKVSILNGELSGNLSGIATIKSFTGEAREVERIRRSSQEYRNSNRRAIRLSSAFSPLIRMVIVLGFTATLVFGGWLAAEGRLAVGSYSVMVFLTQRLLWPLTRLGQTFDLYQRAMASTNRILDLLDLPAAIADGTRPLSREQAEGDILFQGIGFSYQGRSPVVSGLSLCIPAGRTTAIVGSTGAGKSTLVKLLLRFHDVDAGRILLAGTDIREFRLEDLRGAIGLVSQEVFLFHGTIRENIAYGRPDAGMDRIRDAARIAEIDDFVSSLPEQYETVVGERGQKLSGGQRQRISIARAVLKDPPILILDEATSSVDNETEAAIQRSLKKISQGRTTLVIAHRLSTVRNARFIHVLEKGELVETGRHEDLLEKDGLYASLWRVQTGEPSVPEGVAD